MLRYRDPETFADFRWYDWLILAVAGVAQTALVGAFMVVLFLVLPGLR